MTSFKIAELLLPSVKIHNCPDKIQSIKHRIQLHKVRFMKGHYVKSDYMCGTYLTINKQAKSDPLFLNQKCCSQPVTLSNENKMGYPDLPTTDFSLFYMK